jgi:hypothetical protein
VRTLGAKGDNTTDDTAAIQKAIDAHRVVYFPTGFYKVTDTLKLRPDTVLIGLHPSLTQIVCPTARPPIRASAAPKALVESAQGGDNIVFGLGLYTDGANPRATALLWTAGETSMVGDVKFQGGHGTNLADGTRYNPYNGNATADPDPAKRWGGPVSQPVGDQWRRRDVLERLEPQHLRLFGHLRVGHQDARSYLPSLGRAPPAQRDQPQPRRQLGVPGPADRGGGGRGRGDGVAGDPRLEQHPAGQLSRLSRHPDAQAGPGRGQDLQFARHPVPQRGGQRRERFRHLRRDRLRDLHCA